MKYLIDSFRQLDRKQIFIYLFSYLIYIGLNKLFSNSMLFMLGEDSFQQRWTSFSVPCKDTPHAFIISFQLFKIALFALLVQQSAKKPTGLLSQSLIAYFMYDFVYILSFIWQFIPFPIQLSAWWTLISSGQIFLNRYVQYLDAVVAGFWTLALFLLLLKQKQLSIIYIVYRLLIITLTVPLYYLMMYFIWYKN